MGDIEREAFEKEIEKLGYVPARDGDGYLYEEVQVGWDIWQARAQSDGGEAAPVAELFKDEYGEERVHWLTGRNLPDGTLFFTRPPAVNQGVPELNDEVRWILGRPNFACVPMANYLRSQGHEIQLKAEDEQAAVIHWMLTMYAEHGADWRQEVSPQQQEGE